MPNPLARIARHALVWRALLACAIVAVLALIWHFTPLSRIATPQAIVDHVDAISKHWWAVLAFIAAYLLGGFVMFPVTVLGGAVAIIFPPLKAVAISFTGILLSAALHHWIGARFLRKRTSRRLDRVRERLDEVLADQSIVAIAALRTVPIAPFVLVNLVAGCMGVRFRDFMFGTALGLAPSITVMCLFGQRVRAFWHHPTPTGVLLIVGVALVWMGVAFGLQKFLTSWKQKAQKARKAQPARGAVA